MKRILSIGLVVMIALGLWAAFSANLPGSAQTAEPSIVMASQQRFQLGYMLWRGDTKQIYVLYDPFPQQCAGTWEVYSDTWAEGMPETDPNMIPPEGMSQPGRGFGLVWRNNAQVKERLGWVLLPEYAMSSLIYTNGTKTWISGNTDGVFVLNQTNNTWRLYNARSTQPCHDPNYLPNDVPVTHTPPTPTSGDESGD